MENWRHSFYMEILYVHRSKHGYSTRILYSSLRTLSSKYSAAVPSYKVLYLLLASTPFVKPEANLEVTVSPQRSY